MDECIQENLVKLTELRHVTQQDSNTMTPTDQRSTYEHIQEHIGKSTKQSHERQRKMTIRRRLMQEKEVSLKSNWNTKQDHKSHDTWQGCT